MAFSPDGEIIAAGVPIDTNVEKPPRAELYSVEDGEYVGYIETNHTPQDMSFSPDGTILGIGVTTPGVSIYDVDDGTEIRRLHSGFDNRLAFAPDGETLATGNRSSIIWLWQVENGEELAAFEAEGDPGWTSGIAFSHDGDYLIAGYLYGSILFWEISSGHIVNSFDVGERWLIDISLSPDETILAASTNSTTYIIDLTQNTIIEELTLNVGYTYQMGLDFSPDGSLLAIGGVEGIANVYSTADWSLVYSFEHFTTDNEQSRIRSLAFSPDSKKMAVGTGPAGRYEGALYQYSIQRP